MPSPLSREFLLFCVLLLLPLGVAKASTAHSASIMPSLCHCVFMPPAMAYVQKRLEEDLYWIIFHVPPDDLIGQGTELNCQTEAMASLTLVTILAHAVHIKARQALMSWLGRTTEWSLDPLHPGFEHWQLELQSSKLVNQPWTPVSKEGMTSSKCGLQQRVSLV